LEDLKKNKNILEIIDLYSSYDGKNDVISNCSFNIRKGSICAVVGESGSGKSTLLRLIAGLERPKKGTIKINSKIMSSDNILVPCQNRSIGLVFQDYALFPHLKVKENIAYGLKEDKEQIVNQLLQLIKMENYGERYPNELSGGQQQRISLARTLAINPKLLLLDEPFSNLDSELKTELRQEIRKIIKDLGTSLIFITHDIVDAIDIADEIIFLKDGKILNHSSIDEMYQKNNNEYIIKTKRELKYNAEIILKAIKQNTT
jgi:iron(III) transport system ATP-binding protein